MFQDTIIQYFEFIISAPSSTPIQTTTSPTPSLPYELVAERTVCSGFRDFVGYTQVIEECFNACKGAKKRMFAYAHAGENSCNNLGCVCYCEVLTKGEKCKQCTTYDKSYDLYTII